MQHILLVFFKVISQDLIAYPEPPFIFQRRSDSYSFSIDYDPLTLGPAP